MAATTERMKAADTWRTEAGLQLLQLAEVAVDGGQAHGQGCAPQSGVQVLAGQFLAGEHQLLEELVLLGQ